MVVAAQEVDIPFASDTKILVVHNASCLRPCVEYFYGEKFLLYQIPKKRCMVLNGMGGYDGESLRWSDVEIIILSAIFKFKYQGFRYSLFFTASLETRLNFILI